MVYDFWRVIEGEEVEYVALAFFTEMPTCATLHRNLSLDLVPTTEPNFFTAPSVIGVRYHMRKPLAQYEYLGRIGE